MFEWLFDNTGLLFTVLIVLPIVRRMINQRKARKQRTVEPEPEWVEKELTVEETRAEGEYIPAGQGEGWSEPSPYEEFTPRYETPYNGETVGTPGFGVPVEEFYRVESDRMSRGGGVASLSSSRRIGVGLLREQPAPSTTSSLEVGQSRLDSGNLGNLGNLTPSGSDPSYDQGYADGYGEKVLITPIAKLNNQAPLKRAVLWAEILAPPKGMG